MPTGNAQAQMGQVQIVTPTDQRSLPPFASGNRKLTKKRSFIMGFLQGITTISVTIITLTPHYLNREHYLITYSPIWFCIIIFGLSAFFTILAGAKPSHGKVVTVIIASLGSIVASLFLLIFCTITASRERTNHSFGNWFAARWSVTCMFNIGI